MNSDVLIIGGGIQGCAIAYYLARSGVRVTVLEKDSVARHASGVNAGGVRMLGRHLAEVELSKASMKLWGELDNELDADSGYRSCSLINIAADAADMETLFVREQEMRRLGHYHEKIIDQQELRERLPHVAHHCVGGVVSEADGFAIPYKATQAYRRAAVRLGASFVEGARANSVRRVGNMWLVDTEAGHYEAVHLVNCAGAWADQISMMIGDDAPLTYSAPMLMITTRMPRFVIPVVGAVSRVLSFKQFENGTVLIGGGLKGSADRDTNQTWLNYRKLARGVSDAIDFFPIMKTASINRMWAGIEAYMPDKLPVISPSACAENAYHAFGFSAHGFQMGPIVGQLMAELIVGGKPSYSLDAFSIGRFDSRFI